MHCDECYGRGQIMYFGTPVECPECEGSGVQVMTLAKMNGLLVRVRDTGFEGICNVTSQGYAIVINEDDEEVEDLTVDELELLE